MSNYSYHIRSKCVILEGFIQELRKRVDATCTLFVYSNISDQTK